MTPWLTVIGIGDGGPATLSPPAQAALDGAAVVFGGRRHLAMLPDTHPGERRSWRSPFAASADDIRAVRGRPAAILATGDPSWFGPLRWLREVVDPAEMHVLPGASAFSLAASRLGWALETVACLSAHGRPLAAVGPHLRGGAQLIVLSEDGASPAALARLLTQRGFGESRLHVLEHLGGVAERMREDTASAFALADVASLNVVAVQCRRDDGSADRTTAAGLPDDAFRHDGTMTKRVLRALAVAALEPRPGAVLWDVGAGAGSVGIEWLRLSPGGQVHAVEPDADRRETIAANAFALGAHGLSIVPGRAPAALAGLPAPDAVFVGGGLGDGAFEPAFAALRAGGPIVAHAVTLESEARLLSLHARHGGELLRVAVDRAEPLGPFHGWRPAMPVLHWCARKP